VFLKIIKINKIAIVYQKICTKEQIAFKEKNKKKIIFKDS
jgi:hypothetical protein